MNEIPENDAKEQVRPETTNTDQIESDQHEQRHRCATERTPGDCLRIEKRDNEHRSHVIDDSQSSQQQFCADWRLRSNQIERTQSKCYVGCHWNAPTVRTGSAQIENQINQRGRNHSTNCALDWKRRLPGRG